MARAKRPRQKKPHPLKKQITRIVDDLRRHETVAPHGALIVRPVQTVPRTSIERYAAVRQVCSRYLGAEWCNRPLTTLSGGAVGCAVHGVFLGEQVDLSTLSDTADGARRLAEVRDRQDAREIRARRALPFLRVARVRVEEMR